MIGPKKFLKPERESICSKVMAIEQELEKTKCAAILLCKERNVQTHKHLKKLNQTLKDLEVSDLLKVFYSVKPFSPYSPRVRFKDNLHVGVRKGVDLSMGDIIDSDVLREIRTAESEYALEMARFNKESVPIIQKQEQLHNDLIVMTLVEMPYKQRSLHDRVALYVSDPYEETLTTAKIDLRDAKYYQQPHRTSIPNMMINKREAKELRCMMKLQGKEENMNVYFVHNFCKDITSKEMLYEVKTGLQAKYDEQHPKIVEQRLFNMRMKMQKQEEMRKRMAFNHDRAAEQVLLTYGRSRRFAIVDSNGKVSPHLDLDALLNSPELDTILLFNPYERN